MDAVKGKFVLAVSRNAFSILQAAMPEQVALIPRPPAVWMFLLASQRLWQAAGPGFVERPLCFGNTSIDFKNFLSSMKGMYTPVCWSSGMKGHQCRKGLTLKYSKITSFLQKPLSEIALFQNLILKGSTNVILFTMTTISDCNNLSRKLVNYPELETSKI